MPPGCVWSPGAVGPALLSGWSVPRRARLLPLQSHRWRSGPRRGHASVITREARWSHKRFVILVNMKYVVIEITKLHSSKKRFTSPKSESCLPRAPGGGTCHSVVTGGEATPRSLGSAGRALSGRLRPALYVHCLGRQGLGAPVTGGEGATRPGPPAFPPPGLRLQTQQSEAPDASCLPALQVSDVEPSTPCTELEVALAGGCRAAVAPAPRVCPPWTVAEVACSVTAGFSLGGGGCPSLQALWPALWPTLWSQGPGAAAAA